MAYRHLCLRSQFSCSSRNLPRSKRIRLLHFPFARSNVYLVCLLVLTTSSSLKTRLPGSDVLRKKVFAWVTFTVRVGIGFVYFPDDLHFGEISRLKYCGLRSLACCVWMVCVFTVLFL